MRGRGGPQNIDLVSAQAVRRARNRRHERSTRVTAAVRRQTPDSAARIIVERHPTPLVASAASTPPEGSLADPVFETRNESREIRNVVPRRDPGLLK